MVWWDNRASMHRANPYTAEMSARDVRRSTVIDDGEFAHGIPFMSMDPEEEPSTTVQSGTEAWRAPGAELLGISK